MPIDSYEDLIPRNAPKPAPLIEVEATPLVPEVSLLLDQDRNKSVHFNRGQVELDVTENRSTNPQKEVHKEVPYGSQFESYNTWKSKNAQLLSDITGSAGASQTIPNYSNSRKSNNIQRYQSINKDVHCSEDVKSGRSLTRQLPYDNQASNRPVHEYSSRNNQYPIQNINPHSDFPCYSRPNFVTNGYTLPRTAAVMQPPQQYQYPREYDQLKPYFPVTCNSVLPTCKDSQQDLKTQQNVNCTEHHQISPGNNVNQDNSNHCQCGGGHSDVASRNQDEFLNSQRSPTKERKGQEKRTLLPSSLDIAHVNNQAIIDLYHIINLQSEQIFMLQQQVKQVLQLHLDCDKSAKQNFTCQSCPCLQRKNCDSDKTACGSSPNQRDADEHSKSNKKSTHNNSVNEEKSKRSIGVMTIAVEKPEEIKAVRPTENYESSNIKQKKKKHMSPVVPTIKQPSYRNQRNVIDVDVGRRKKRTPNNTNKHNQVESSKVDNSFSLNEAELIIRTTSEQEDQSPNTSVHVDLQDYYSSSVDSEDSEGTASSSNEDEKNSGSEDTSNDPPLSWTFYNRVVGRVNKILKKTPSPPQNERHHRPPVNPMYGMNADYETENNWSKRVTFDGPPPDDSDNNVTNMREYHRYNQPVPVQDLKMNDGHGRMQDFMMYNFANGNTNLSFASLRYLDQYQQLPSKRQPKAPEQMYHHGYQKEQKSSKKSTKKKTRNFDKYSDVPPQISKRKSSSKLLDITALKQQPKLF